jgi:hypothetical protein
MAAIGIKGGKPSTDRLHQAGIGAGIAKQLNHAEQGTWVRSAFDRLHAQLFGKRVPHLDRHALLVFPTHPAHPGSQGQCEQVQRLSRSETISDRVHQDIEWRIRIDPLDCVLDCRIREALDQCCLVARQVDPRNSR